MYNTIIVGGGVAGLFIGTNLKSSDSLILEGSKKIGQKILITGGGMCNITNMDDNDTFLSHFGGKKQTNFLKPSIYNLSTEKTRKYLESIGLELTIRDDGKVFPKSLRAQTVIDIFQKKISKNGTRIKYNAKVKDIKLAENSFILETENETFNCKNLIITTGGKSYPETGSDGSMYKLLKKVGCKIVEATPALVGVKIRNYPFKLLSGNSIKHCNVDFFRNGESKKYLSSSGDLLFTHQGLSGPVILNNSREISAEDYIYISLIPCQNKEEKRLELLHNMNTETKITIKRFLKGLGLTTSMVDFLGTYLKLDLTIPIKSVNKKVKNSILNTLLNFKLVVSSKIGFNGAMVTAGGVDLSEINRKTMMYKNIQGLYFAGEVIDVDGDTGGYNIQAAFSTAKLIADNLNQQTV